MCFECNMFCATIKLFTTPYPSRVPLYSQIDFSIQKEKQVNSASLQEMNIFNNSILPLFDIY